MKAVILAGGNGTRLKKYNPDITKVPKPMLKLGEIPLIEIILRQLVKHGFNDITISTRFLSDVIEKHLKNINLDKVTIKVVKEEERLGTSGPLSIIPDLNETFLVIHGDILTNLNFSKLLKFHKEKNSDMTLAVSEIRLPAIGSIEYEGEMIKQYRDKKSETYLDSMSIFICEPSVFEFMEKNSFLNLDEFVNKLVENNKKVLAYKTKEFFQDIGIDEDYEKAQEIFKVNKDIFLTEN